KQISPKEALPLSYKLGASIDYGQYQELISKLANLSELTAVEENQSGAVGFLVGRDEFFVSIAQNIDVEAEKERIQKEIAYLTGFLKGVNAKLANERFVQNAKPEIVQNEQNKKTDAEAKLSSLKESLASL